MADKSDKVKLKQTKVPDHVIGKLKAQAAIERRNVKEIYEEAIYDFFADRREHLKKSSALDLYNAPPSSGTVLNVELKPSTAHEVEAIAAKDDATGSRVIYTSLIQYAKKKKLI